MISLNKITNTKRKSYFLFILFSFLCYKQVKSQSTDCATATGIDVSTGSACVSGTTSNAGTGYILGGCNATAVPFVWYTFVANGSTDTYSVTPGTLTNPEIVIFTNSCPAVGGGHTQACNSSVGSTPVSTTWGLTIGEQVWIGVGTNGGTNGTFTLCVNSVPPAPAAGNTCAQAIPICNTTFSLANMAVNSSGQRASCFGSASQEDVFVQFTVTKSGTLAWTATPNTLTDEFDWALWDISSGCPGTEVCCNYNYANGSSSGFGMQNIAGNGACGVSSVGAPAAEFSPTMTVTCGKTYAIQISNSNNTGRGFSLAFPNSTFSLTSSSAFVATPTLVCGTTLTAAITNNSTGNCNTEVWTYGDGTTYNGTSPPNHTYTATGTYAITETIGGNCTSTATHFVELLAPIAITATSTPAACSTGSCTGTASASAVTGGDGVYTYSWSTGSTATNISALCTGIYSVTVSNAKCGNSTQTVSVNAPPALTLTPTPTDATCGSSNGSISLAATGGTSPYTYSMNGGAFSATTNYTALGPGTYTFQVKDKNGCETTTTVNLTQTNSITVTANSVTICPGGTATLTVTGGTTYSWSAGVTPTTGSIVTVSPGANTTYTVTGTSAGCSGTGTANVTIGPGVTVTATSATICAGQTATLTASGATTYNWSAGVVPTTGSVVTVSPAVNASYTVTGTANGCTATATSTVSVTPNPTITVNSPTICPGGTATLTANGATTYNWSAGVAPTTGSVVTVSPGANTSYTVTGTTATCTATATAAVTIGPGISLTISSATICAGGAATLTATGATNYTWTPALGLNVTTGSVVVANPTNTSIYTVTGVTGACSGTGTTAVSVTPNPTVIVNNPTICAGQTATLTATGATTYNWSAGVTPTTGNMVTVSPAVNASYTVTGTKNGCNGTAVATVSITPNPIVTVNSPTICPGGTATLTANGATTYTWSTGATTAIITESPAANTSYTVIGTTNSCTNSAIAAVTIAPSLAISVNSPTICSGSSTTLTATGGTTYSWTPAANLNTTTGSSVTANPVTTSTYVVTGITGGCSGTATAVVTVAVSPTAAFNVAPVCQGAGSVFNNTSTSDAICAWSFGAAGNPASAASNCAVANTFTYSSSGTFPVSLTVTAVGGCTATATSNAIVNPVPTASFTAPTVCLGNPTLFSSTITNGNTYSWTFGDGNTNTTSATPSNTYTSANTFPVSLTVTAVGGCSVMATGNAVVNAIPTAAFNVSPVCQGVGSVFNNTSTLDATCAWSFGAVGNPASAASNCAAANTFTYSSSGTFPVSLTVTTTSGCTAIATDNALVNVLPTASFTAPTVCLGNATAFSSTITNSNNFNWTFGDGNTNTTSATPSNTYLTAGTFPVSLTVTAVGGCSVTTTGNAVVNIQPTASFTVGPECLGTATFFDATASIPVAATYSWSFGGTGNPNTASLTNIQTDNYTYPSTGTFPVTLLVSVGNCTATATGNAVVNPFPVLGFTANAPCDGSAVNFTNTTTNQASIENWSWNLGDGSVAVTTAIPTPYTYATDSCYTVVLTATAITGCSDSFSATVNVHPNPVAYFNAWEACLGTASEFKDSSFIQNPACLTDKITSWQWSFGDGNTANYTTATLPDTVKYTYANCGPYNITLTVTTNNGCTNTNSLTGDTVFCLPVVTGPLDFSVCPGFTTPGQNFTTTCANGGDPTAVWFQSLKDIPSNNTGAPTYFTTTGGNDVVPSYSAIAQNITCNILQDTVYAIAISGVGCYGNAVYYTANVFPTPMVTTVKPITVCANQPVNVPAFTGCPTPETFNWTSSTTPSTVNTGIAASGTGDINTFTGTNTTDAIATSVVSVTPLANGCIGTPTSFNIVINPVPTMTVTSYTVCPTDNIPSIIPVTNPANGVSFTWSATNNANIGLAAIGTGTIGLISHTAPANATLVPQTGIITYVPTLSGCVGSSTTDTICVKPTPFMQYLIRCLHPQLLQQ